MPLPILHCMLHLGTICIKAFSKIISGAHAASCQRSFLSMKTKTKIWSWKYILSCKLYMMLIVNKDKYLPVKLHVITFQTIILFIFTAIRNSNDWNSLFLDYVYPDQLSSSYNVKSDTGKVLFTIDALQEVGVAYFTVLFQVIQMDWRKSHKRFITHIITHLRITCNYNIQCLFSEVYW